MDMKFCLSCSMPLNNESAGKNPKYCKHCTDQSGNLHSREHVQQGISQFLKMLQPDIDEATALERARHYLKAMPAWADQ